MARRQLNGWLFDIDELGPEIVLWVYTGDRQLVRLTETFHQPVYVSGERTRLRLLAWELRRRGIISNVRWVRRQEFWSGESLEVLELHVCDASLMPRLRRFAAARDEEFVFFNIDIPAAQYYLYLKRLYPLCHLSCEIDEQNRILAVAATDSVWDIKQELPPLRTLRLRGQRMRPFNDASRITIECEGEQATIRFSDGATSVRAFNMFVERHDPDVILSDAGDTLLFPALLRLAKTTKVDLQPDRDRLVTQRKIVTEGRTYFSYGRVIYKGPSYPLFGRWHIDTMNSFIHRETGMAGLIELARLAKIPVQRTARVSPGTAMSSMQVDQAIRDGILIPWHKSEPEKYKTGLELLTIDKGGLSFQPRVGVFENVAEIDFTSMYPSLMVQHNISPETVLCSCCTNGVVPEANYNICEKRRGLIPHTLEPLLERRKQFKQMMRQCDDSIERENCDAMQTAIKWMMVSCFGYLGHRNARFGRIEAHEAVTAYGREKLLKAKELAEAAGYRVLHALTDSLWIKRDALTEAAVRHVCEAISRATQVEMICEGIYHWVVFLPSKVNSQRPVATRYYGIFNDGRLKIRGLACRRADTPPYIKDVQVEMLEVLASARSAAERRQAIERAKTILEERTCELEEGRVDPRRLMMRRTLTKGIADYKTETRTATAARQLESAGVKVHPGEQVRYLVTNAGAKEKARRVRAEELAGRSKYDAAEYVKLLQAAAAEVLWDVPSLD